jgi:hypothetical protein
VTRSQRQKKQKEELQDYSKDVQRRIAKLTGKWREAERQRDEALTFAKSKRNKKNLLLKNILQLNKLELKIEKRESNLVWKRSSNKISSEQENEVILLMKLKLKKK